MLGQHVSKMNTIKWDNHILMNQCHNCNCNDHRPYVCPLTWRKFNPFSHCLFICNPLCVAIVIKVWPWGCKSKSIASSHVMLSCVRLCDQYLSLGSLKCRHCLSMFGHIHLKKLVMNQHMKQNYDDFWWYKVCGS
jgi:hypothetical protein